MITLEDFAPQECATVAPQAQLILPYALRCKSRQRVTLIQAGKNIDAYLHLKRGGVLRDGDRLMSHDGLIVLVVSASEKLMKARTLDSLLLAKTAYHLGNRHVAVEIAQDALIFAHDHVLGDMVRGLGLAVESFEGAFEPERGAYDSAPSHHHGESPTRFHDHHHALKIHEFSSRP